MVYLNERRLLINNMKLMLIMQPMVARPQLSNRLIMLIQKSSMSVSMSVQRIVHALEREEDVFPFVARCLEVGRPDREVGEAGPDEVAGGGEDVGSWLERPVACAFAVPGEGRYEEIPWGDGGGGWDGDI